MKSIYERALGSAFKKLHPKLQERFRLHSQSGIYSIGKGYMNKIWRGPFLTLPFLYLGTRRRILFPQQGKNIPFTISNYAYVDRYGRETVAWIRRFYFDQKVRHFDATMIFSEKKHHVIDYLGTHQHIAVDINLSVSQRGGVHLTSGSQRLYEGPIHMRIPLLFSGSADVHEWYDDEQQKFMIEVNVQNPLLGSLFGYKGSYEMEYRRISTEDIPAGVKPRREEHRE